MLSEPIAPPDGRELGAEGLRWAEAVLAAARRHPHELTPTQRDFARETAARLARWRERTWLTQRQRRLLQGIEVDLRAAGHGIADVATTGQGELW